MPFSKEASRWGLAKESVRLTAETAPTDWISVDKGADIDHKVEMLEDNGLRGVKADFPSTPGMKVTGGKVPFPLRARPIAYFFNMLLGAPVTEEQAVVTVESGVNDKIDLAEDGGAPVAATLAAGSYPIGATSALAGSFCKLVKDALEAANGADTYTVAYDSSTRKFTITKSAGVFVLQWNTGANTATCAAALLGFATTADTASAIAATSSVAVSNRVFKHTFGLPAGIQPPTYTFFIDRSLAVKKYNGVAVKKMELKASPNGLIQHDSEVVGLTEADGAIGSPSYANEGNPLAFMHATVKVGGVANVDVKEWSLSIDSGAFAKRTMSGSQVAADILAPAKLKVSGSFTIYFENETERAKFLAGTSNSFQVLIEGDTLAGAVKETVDVTLPKVIYKAYPYGEADNMLAAQVAFDAVYDTATSKLVGVDVINKLASV